MKAIAVTVGIGVLLFGTSLFTRDRPDTRWRNGGLSPIVSGGAAARSLAGQHNPHICAPGSARYWVAQHQSSGPSRGSASVSAQVEWVVNNRQQTAGPTWRSTLARRGLATRW